MEESDVTESGESNNTSSSISNAVNELLCMTNAAVKKLTDPRQALSDSSLSVDPEASDRNTSDDRHGDKRLLEILSETKNTTIEDNAEAETHELQDETSSQNVESRGKVIDVTSALADAAKSPVSILDVGGGEMDSSASTPPTNRPLETDLSPGAGLSPIMLETHGRREDEEIEGSFIESIRHKEGKDNLTSSVKSGVKSDSPNASRNSSTASEVLKLSSRVPALPESARLPNSHMKTQPTPDKESGELKQPETVVIELEEKPANVIIRKSQHARDAAADRIAPPERERVAPHRVRVPKKRMQEVERPIATNEQGNSEQHHPRTGTKPQSAASPMKSTLSQGVATTLDDKENKGADPRLDKDLKIIKSDVGSTKKRLLEARKTGMQYKRTVPANIVNEKTMHKRIAQSHPSEVMAYAMQHTAPMIKVQQDLEAQVVRLTDKLNELERQKQREESLKHQERSVDLERKLDEVTAQRLRSLEQLQEQQAAWQGQFLKVVGNMQNTQNQLNDAVTEKGTVPGRTVRFDDFKRSHDVLQTPAPRPQAPHPTLSKERRKGTSPGNGYLLKNILEQMDVSTPGPSPAVYPAKLARDPLVEVTPVRGPAQKPLGMTVTSTPHADDDDRAAVRRAKKSAREEAERLEIMKRFPGSIHDYMLPEAVSGCDRGVSGKILQHAPDAPLDSIWSDLKELQTRRKILDANLAIVERGRGGEDIAAAVEYDLLLSHPEIDPAKAEELRVKKMVDDQIKSLQQRPAPDTICGPPGVAGVRKAERSKVGGKKSRLPAAVTQRAEKGGKKPATQAMLTQKTRPRDPRADSEDVLCPDTEDFVTRVYGKAEYQPRRTTVHNPYFHVKSPVKKPTFRKKKAVEIVKASMVKSARTQTSPTVQSPQPRYYFTPTSSPVRPPISTSPTPGQLIPMAVPLGPPVISNAPDPTPVVIHQTDPAYTTFVVDTPKQKKIRIYNPADASHTRKPNTAVISIRGEDGPDLSVHKMDNIDIDTPEVSEMTEVKEIYSPVRDTVPGSRPVLKHDKDESEGSDASLHIELRGAANSGAPLDYHGPSFPPARPQGRELNADDIADEIDKHELEQETVRWVEQEILARILSELHPPGSHDIRDSGPVQSPGDPGALNPESLQLYVDAGLPVDDATINRLVEEELTRILREMIKRPAQDQNPPRPKTPVPKTRPPKTPSHQVPTPLPTPDPSPCASVSEQPHLHTPSLTPDSSMAESLPVKDPSPAPSPEARAPSPEVDSPPKTPEEVTLVETPCATPSSTPKPEPAEPRTPVLSVKSVSPPVTPKRVLPDPWGDAQFPLPEEMCAPKPPSAGSFAPPPEAVDLVVRTLTPPPATPTDRSLSEGDTTTTLSSDRGESSISEGQLLISHGEVRAKMKRGQLPGIIEDIFGEEDVKKSLGFHSTLKDAKEMEDYEEHSDGEVRLSARPAMISRVIGLRHPGDDPVGVYARPRHPLPEETDEDLSVGEIKPETMVNRKSKFRKWREDRSPKYSQRSKQRETLPPAFSASHDSPPLSVDDLRAKARTDYDYSQSADSARTSADSVTDDSFDANVIVVGPRSEPSVPKREEPMRSEMPKAKDTLTSTDFQKTLASTDHSGVIKDSLEESTNRRDFFDQGARQDARPSNAPAMKVSLTLPTADQAPSVSSVSDVSEMSGPGM